MKFCCGWTSELIEGPSHCGPAAGSPAIHVAGTEPMTTGPPDGKLGEAPAKFASRVPGGSGCPLCMPLEKTTVAAQPFVPGVCARPPTAPQKKPQTIATTKPCLNFD